MWYNSVMDARIKAYAKLNLTLEITGTENGFHNLDSVVCTVDLFDLIKMKKRKDKNVTVDMRGRGSEAIPYENNNAIKAAQAYINAFGTDGVDIKIYKNIPLGAGMGGSSADAAGVLRGMSKLYGTGSERQLKALADGLGSDTGYMLGGGFARLFGRGDRVRKINSAVKLNFLLLAPESGVSTAACYKLYDSCQNQNLNEIRQNLSGGGKNQNVGGGQNLSSGCGQNSGSGGAAAALEAGDVFSLSQSLNNALFAPACKLNSDVLTAFDELKSFAPLGVNMTGSGSAVFALFENAEMCAWAKSRYRGAFECLQLKSV